MNEASEPGFVFTTHGSGKMMRPAAILRKVALASALGVCLSVVSCSVGPVMTTDLQHHPGAEFMDPVKHPVIIMPAKVGDKTYTLIRRDNATIFLAKPERVKYEWLRYEFADTIAVRATLPNGRSYVVYLDTGFGGYLAVNDLIVREAGLPIYPMGKDAASRGFTGMCYLPWIEIGKMGIVNPPCDYLQVHWELQFIGIPLWQEKWVIMGLRLLREFPYIAFDNVRQEVVFSPEGPFEPTDPGNWSRFPFQIAQDKTGKLRITVHMPVAGKVRAVDFDTCGGDALLVRPGAWREIATRVKADAPTDGQFASAQLGWLPCKRTVARDLEVASLRFATARVQILPEDSPYASGIDCQIGMGFFKDTVVVIDFEDRWLWVKRNPRR